MVTDTEGYVHIIEYLTEHLSLFENSSHNIDSSETIKSLIEQELSEQIMIICNQNDQLTFNQRNIIIREIDAIVYDLEEILSGVINNKVNDEQTVFIQEFSLLIKNLFDSEVHSQFLS